MAWSSLSSAKVPEGGAAADGSGGLPGFLLPPLAEGGEMGAALHLPPGDDDPGPVLAEDGVRRVGGVPLGVVAAGLDDGVLLRAGGVAAGDAAHPALAPGVGRQVPDVAPEL